MLPSILIVVQFLSQFLPTGGSVKPRAIVAELRNGSEIEGTLVGEDASTWVIGVSGGELRIAKSRVLRIVPRDNAAGACTASRVPGSPDTPGPDRETVTMALPPPAAMSFDVPSAWTEKKLDGRELALTDPTQSLLLGISTVSDSHSLWSFTSAIKKDYLHLYPGFAIEREKFAATAFLRSWEVEFRYEKNREEFRELHLMLDFGETKRIFAFTAAAARFNELVSRFRSVVSSFAFPAADKSECDGAASLFA